MCGSCAARPPSRARSARRVSCWRRSSTATAELPATTYRRPRAAARWYVLRSMPTRSRLVALVPAIFSSALLAACVSAPDDTAQLSGDHALVQRSQNGLVEATIALDGSEIARGVNDFSI